MELDGDNKYHMITHSKGNKACPDLGGSIFVLQGPVVQRPISADPGLNFNRGFLVPLLKSLFGIIFSVLFEVSNSHTLD